MKTSITDPTRRMVFARIGDEIRMAGMADIGGRSCRLDTSRFAVMRENAATAFSDCYGVDSPHAPWTGARPCTPSSQPRIGTTTLPVLFVIMGHGTLGWTLCPGSAAQLGAVIGSEFPLTFASGRKRV
jgi:D-amino-acid dehydrogenase